jgi:uncharacterized membrane protein
VTFANPLPWWALLGVVVAAALVAWQGYRRFATTPFRRRALTAIRFVTLVVIVVVLMRPVARRTDFDARDAVVPILVDTSRSMGIEDVDGKARIVRARQLVAEDLLPALDGRFQTEVLAFGESLAPASVESLGSAGRRSDLTGALAAVRERFRGRPVAGIVVISDGGDTGAAVDVRGIEPVAPVYAFGVGAERISADREVLSVTAAEAVLDQSRVDLAVSAVGSGTDPLELRLLENGRPIEVRRVAPSAAGGPVREVFHVAPPNGAPTVYTVEIPTMPRELVPENNTRSVLVLPPGRQRRVLLVEGAPGFEHSFLKRALAGDTGLELDSVVRKGVNEQGADTFYIQAARSRAQALTQGFPSAPEALFAYDAIVFGSVAGAQLTVAQLEMARDFVARRGGGLLVLGAQSFLNKGLIGTPIEDTLPVTLNQRAETAVPAVSVSRAANRVAVTEAGLQHPIMQVAPAAEENKKRWDALPPLAATAGSGAVRPGGTVLATTAGAGGVSRALVAVQRYGEGRSMVFTGEASWRWRMMLPSTDHTYETFWRQAIRWLAIGATDPLTVFPVPATAPGDEVTIRAAVRDRVFAPLRDAQVEFRVYGPDGKLQRLAGALENVDPEADGSAYMAKFQSGQPGIYKVTVHARQGVADAGTASSSFLVGGADVEMTDPRLNLPLLSRVASASGGQVFSHDQSAPLLEALRSNAPSAALAVREDLWHNAWSLGFILSFLASEWVLRRRWGLR